MKNKRGTRHKIITILDDDSFVTSMMTKSAQVKVTLPYLKELKMEEVTTFFLAFVN